MKNTFPSIKLKATHGNLLFNKSFTENIFAVLLSKKPVQENPKPNGRQIFRKQGNTKYLSIGLMSANAPTAFSMQSITPRRKTTIPSIPRKAKKK